MTLKSDHARQAAVGHNLSDNHTLLSLCCLFCHTQVCATAGFTAVFEMMRDSNKPAVGHNLSYDLTFCLASFAQALPPSWDAYKQLVQRWFPAGVWDTKHLARQLQVRKAQRAGC